jgi:ABC-type sugar transport system permease subunit
MSQTSPRFSVPSPKRKKHSSQAAGGQSGTRRSFLYRIGDYAFLFPALFLVGALLLASGIFTLVISFTSWNLIGTPEPVGLENYEKLLTDPTTRVSLFNTVIWVIGSLALPVAGGLLLAVFLETVPLRGLWKAIIYLPVVIAPTVTGVMWKQIYGLTGPLNEALVFLGLEGLQREWLTDTPLNTFVMVITSTWRTIGPAMVLFLIALQTIPRESIEAALLDGAGSFRMFWSVKLPQIRAILVVVVTMAVVNSFATYDFVWVMTQGGPYQSSETLAVTIYRLAFSQWQVGFASALAVLLSLVTLAFSIIYIWRGIERQGSTTQGGSK